jgi:hypothetical protein
MNSSGAAILVNPHPCGHIVYPYTDENLVGQAVSLYACAGLRNGESVILILTKDHHESIMHRLKTEGLNTDEYKRTGRLICLHSEHLFGRLTTDGFVNEGMFKTIVGDLIKRARASSGDRYLGRVRLFGEMVSQLRNLNLTATASLERLWNQMIDAHSVPLLCTYALHHPNDQLPHALMDLHSHIIQQENPAIQ